MASPQASQRFLSRNAITRVDHDPGSTDATLASADGGTTLNYYDMQNYGRFAVLATNQALTGAGITKVEIVASATTTFSSVTVIKDSGTVAADALADWVALECSAEEVAQEAADAGANLRYVTARLTVANAADESCVFLIASEPRFSDLNLTPASTIA